MWRRKCARQQRPYGIIGVVGLGSRARWRGKGEDRGLDQMKDISSTEKGHKGREGKGRGLSEDVSKTIGT